MKSKSEFEDTKEFEFIVEIIEEIDISEKTLNRYNKTPTRR